MSAPFAAAARELVKRFDFSYGSFLAERVKWRHHGLGMLQAEFADDLRVHVWHPCLKRMEGWRNVHDHRFDLVSAVVVGAVTDVPCHVFEKEPPEFRTELVPCSEITHAKAQKPGELPRPTSQVWAVLDEPVGWSAGSVYTIARREFHTTRVSGLAITVVHRQNFDERPARVLGTSESGIVHGDLEATWKALQAAEIAQGRLRAGESS
jgi:hypothetical protein